MREFVGYGLVNPNQAREYASAVCDVLGHGERGGATIMLLETAAQETHVGRYRDPTPNGAGRGLCQVDEIAFVDVVARSRDKNLGLISQAFGIDMAMVQHRDLDFSPLLSFIVCRLFYMLIPEPFPLDLAGRAQYWKTHYNTKLGKGTVDEYIHNVKRFL